MANQLNSYTFTIIKQDNEKMTVTYTTRSPTQAKLRAKMLANKIGGNLEDKYIKNLTPTKPQDQNMKDMIQKAYFE